LMCLTEEAKGVHLNPSGVFGLCKKKACCTSHAQDTRHCGNIGREGQRAAQAPMIPVGLHEAWLVHEVLHELSTLGTLTALIGGEGQKTLHKLKDPTCLGCTALHTCNTVGTCVLHMLGTACWNTQTETQKHNDTNKHMCVCACVSVVCVCACEFPCACACVCVLVCVCTCMRAFVRACVGVCAYIYIYIYIYSNRRRSGRRRRTTYTIQYI